MCTVLLPPGVNPIAVNKYIYLYLAKLSASRRLCQVGATEIRKREKFVNP